MLGNCQGSVEEGRGENIAGMADKELNAGCPSSNPSTCFQQLHSISDLTKQLMVEKYGFEDIENEGQEGEEEVEGRDNSLESAESTRKTAYFFRLG